MSYEITPEELALREKIEHFITEKAAVTTRLTAAQADLSGLNSKCRTRRLRPEDYRKTCERQQRIKSQIAADVAHVQSINGHIRKLQAQVDALHVAKQPAQSVAEVGDGRLDAVAAKLIEMRRYYLEFARDDTRVNSMRKLAAEFSSRLTEVLKDAKP